MSCPESRLEAAERRAEAAEKRVYELEDPCGCRRFCGDDGDIDGPGCCVGLPRHEGEPLARERLAREEAEAKLATVVNGMASVPADLVLMAERLRLPYMRETLRDGRREYRFWGGSSDPVVTVVVEGDCG